MSAFLPIDPTAGQQQKRALLEKLLQQHMQNAARYAGQAGSATSSPVAASGSTPFRSSHPFGGRGLVVQAPHPLPPGYAGSPGDSARPGYMPPSVLSIFTNPHGAGAATPLTPSGGSGNPMPGINPGGPMIPAVGQPPSVPSLVGAAQSLPVPASFLPSVLPINPNAGGVGGMAHPGTFNPGLGAFVAPPKISPGSLF